MTCAPLVALAGEGARPGSAPGFASSACHVSPAGLRARHCSRSSRPRRLRRVSGVRVLFRRGGEEGGCGSPALVFPPSPPLWRRPFRVRIIGRGGTPSPFGRLRSLTGGNRTAAIFVCLCRRPSAFARLWRTQSGPPAEISPPLTEHPRSPAVLRGPVARTPAVRVPHGSRACTVAAVPARLRTILQFPRLLGHFKRGLL